jgi:VanZ family protein
MKKFQIFKRIFFLVAFIVFILAVIPAQKMPELNLWDKSNHFIAFFVLTALFIYAFKYKYHIAFIELLAYGVFIEIAQYFSINRSSEFLDVVADGLGIITAIILIYLFRILKTINYNSKVKIV